MGSQKRGLYRSLILSLTLFSMTQFCYPTSRFSGRVVVASSSSLLPTAAGLERSKDLKNQAEAMRRFARYSLM